MIAKTLQTKIGEAMKAHDETRTSTLRLLLSAFNYEQINKQHDLTEEEELAVIRREAKKRKEAVEMYKGAGADDRAAKEEAELAILQEYLPPEMGEEELAKIIDEAFTQIKPAGLSDMGKVVGFVKGKAPNADGGKIAEIVKGKLS
ncbi:hypothetical protein A2573_00935 [Candidatus Woesebacteria bacterium RIFOXYD1_FULL_43_18]|uniref:Glutamyl-tRNA amidotransferase n=1 Tax=Candidatus Woesebacteria bacterium RIFOXYD1_FULL_43_18 TaxID=1802551 RepID=A0A1F8DHH5_9BACT|nr:MAG: hypothetical protein A2573_00935 [Candidatus Woesebacteria bacterium RIFOXYD1_FULL_43_18]